MQYAITLTPDTNGTFLIQCRDFSELASAADSFEEAFNEGLDALETCFMMYMDCRRPIPAPTPAQDGEQLIDVPIKVAMKVALYNEMLAQGVTKAEMARRLDGFQASIDRILSLRHATRLDTLEAAFAALGKRLELHVTCKTKQWSSPP